MQVREREGRCDALDPLWFERGPLHDQGDIL